MPTLSAQQFSQQGGKVQTLTPQDFTKQGGKVQSFPKEEPPAVKQSFMQKVGSAITSPIKTGIQNVKTAGSEIGQSFTGGIGEIKQGFQQADSKTGNPVDLVEGVGKIGAGAVSSLFSPAAPLTNLIGKGIDKATQPIQNNPSVQKFANSKAGETTSRVAGDVANYANIAGTVGGAMEAAPSIKAGLEKVPGAVNDFADNTIGKSAMARDVAKIDAGKAIQAPKVAGKIVQGDITDIPKAQKALSQIDVSKVKTYQDLGKALDSKISDVSKLQDQALNTRPEAIHLEDLTSQGHNFVKDAIDQMSEFYKKTNDVTGQKKMTGLAQKAQTQGLSIQEVNQLARDHGATLNAFNANGELASGLTKQAAENTRQGLKSTVRNYMGDKALQGSDAQLSDLIRTKSLVGDVADKANALAQKIQERGLLGKIGYGIGKVIDTTTGGALKNFVNYFIPRGEGLKTLNALDLEKALQTNLSRLQDLTEGKMTNTDFTSQLNDLIKKGNPQKLLPEPKAGTPKASVEIPIEQGSQSQSTLDSNQTKNMVRSKVRTINPKLKPGGGKITQIFGEPTR